VSKSLVCKETSHGFPACPKDKNSLHSSTNSSHAREIKLESSTIEKSNKPYSVLAKQSERDRQQIKALQQASVAALQQAIHNKQVLRQLPEPFSSLKSDSQSDDEVESVSETGSQHSEESSVQPFGYQELILGISIGFAIGFYFDSLFVNQ
jgi:hypothetical protein